MITKFDKVLLRHCFPYLTGAWIDTFEYFLCIYSFNKDFKLVLLNGSEFHINRMIDIINERYNLDGIEDYTKNIEIITRKDLLRTRFKKVLILDYTTLRETKGFLSSDEIIIVSENTEDRYFFKKNLYNVKYYGEMPFVYKDQDYKMKFLFERYKPIQKEENVTLVNNPNILQYLTLNRVLHKIYEHRKNFFELFDTYAYLHDDSFFDPRTRLFHECMFYNKQIIYIDKSDIKDGSYYRYQDLLKHGLTDRYLNQTDEIVMEFI